MNEEYLKKDTQEGYVIFFFEEYFIDFLEVYMHLRNYRIFKCKTNTLKFIPSCF